MRLTVFEHGTTVEAPPICLQLFAHDNLVDLRVVDAVRGEPVGGGTIATIYSDGTMRRHASVSKDIGLSLDENGKIVIK